MKRIALFLVIALSFARAAEAANGTVGASTSDAVTISVSGGDFQNVHWEVRTAGTSKLTTEYSIDGTNWLPAAFSVQANAVSANPATAAWQNTTAVAGAFDTPISANTMAFRIRCGTTGTSTVLTLVAGKDYEPGAQVFATLYDTTSGTNSALDTGTLDVSGWSLAAIVWIPSGATATAAHVWPVDEAGVSINGQGISQSITTAWSAHYTGGVTAITTNGLGSMIAVGVLPRRIRADAAAVAAQTTRIRIEARR